MLTLFRKYVLPGIAILLFVIVIGALSIGFAKAWVSTYRTLWLTSFGVVVALAVILNSRAAAHISRLTQELFRLTKFIGICVLLIALIGFIVRLSSREGVTILAFDDETKDTKYNGKAIADSLQVELSRIENTLALPREDTGSSERLMPMHFGQESEHLNESVKDIGTIGAGEAKISVGALLLACKRFWPIGGPGTAITGCVQRFGESIRIVARVESNGDIHSYEITRPAKTDDEILGMVRQLAFKIAKALQDPKHPISAKTSEALEKFIKALESYDRFTVTGDTTDLDAAKQNCLGAFNCETDYKKLFYLLTEIGIAYAEIKDYRSATDLFEEAASLEPKSATAHNNLGLMLGRLQRTEEAREEFNKAKSLSEQTPDALEIYFTNLGDAQRYASHFDEAEGSYDKAIKQNQNSISALLGLAEVCLAKADYNSAREHLTRASLLNPNEVKPHLLLGDLFETIGDYDSARSEYDKAIAIDSQNAEAFNGLGYICLELGDVETAIGDFQQAIDSADKYSSPHVGLGNALRAKGDIDATKSEYKHAWLLDPLDDAPHNALGELLLDRREFNEAESEFRKAIELAPASPTEHINLGNLFLVQGKYEEARNEYDVAERISPKNRELLYSLGDWYMARHEYDNAERKYSAAVEAAPRSPWSHIKLGNLHRARSSLDLAKDEYQLVVSLAPKLADGYNGLADTSYDLGDYKTALEQYLHASQLAAGWSDPHVGLGNTYYATADLENAAVEYGRAIAITPLSSTAHAYLGDIYWRNRNYDKAVAEYSLAANIDPRDAYPHARLGALLLFKGKNQEAKAHCEAAYNLQPREYTSGFILGVEALLRNQSKQAEDLWNKILLNGDRRNVDDELDRFMILCALNKRAEAQTLLEDHILSLAIRPVGLLLEKMDIVNNPPLNRFDRFAYCRTLLMSATAKTTNSTTGKESGETRDTPKRTSLPP